jgi:hypothetical protein
LGGRLAGTQAALFFAKTVSKKYGNNTFYVWSSVGCLLSGLGRRLEQHFGGFFHQIRSASANRKKGFYTSRLPKDEDILKEFLYKAVKNFKLFFENSIQNLKI